MSTETILDTFQEFLFILIVFDVFLVYAIVRGRQAVVNMIMSLYFALLIMLEFPYFNVVGDSAFVKMGLFAVFTILSLFVMSRIMPDPFRESRFESMGKKTLLALGATILTTIYSYHVLAITDFISLGSPIDQIFGPEGLFFWWLLIPMLILFIL